jgi:hypothetical protein
MVLDVTNNGSAGAITTLGLHQGNGRHPRHHERAQISRLHQRWQCRLASQLAGDAVTFPFPHFMTVSSSTNFSLSASDVIVAARRKLGIQAQEETLEAADLTDGLTTLNMMLKAWQADGVMCWTFSEVTFVLAQADTTVTFGAGMDITTIPFEIVSMNINRGSNDIPMIPLSRQDYRRLPNKTTQGYPTQYFYQRDRSGGTLYIWPAADASGGRSRSTPAASSWTWTRAATPSTFPRNGTRRWFTASLTGLPRIMGWWAPPRPSKSPEGCRVLRNRQGQRRWGWGEFHLRRALRDGPVNGPDCRAALRHAGRAVQSPCRTRPGSPPQHVRRGGDGRSAHVSFAGESGT